MLNERYNSGVFADTAPTAGESIPVSNGIKYIAKFENDDISIYMSDGTEEIFLYSLDNLDGIRDARLLNFDRLESTLKSGILFNILSIFV